MSLRLIRTSVIHNDKTTLHTQKKTFHYTNEISGFKVRQTKWLFASLAWVVEGAWGWCSQSSHKVYWSWSIQHIYDTKPVTAWKTTKPGSFTLFGDVSIHASAIYPPNSKSRSVWYFVCKWMSQTDNMTHILSLRFVLSCSSVYFKFQSSTTAKVNIFTCCSVPLSDWENKAIAS